VDVAGQPRYLHLLVIRDDAVALARSSTALYDPGTPSKESAMRRVLLLAVLPLGFAPAPFPRAKPRMETKWVTLQSGLKYQDLKVGSGVPAKKGDTLLVHYTGWLARTAKQIDSSTGKKPFEFELGAGKVIKGWDEGVAGMKPGGKRKLLIPAELAYGAEGHPAGIPPNADLIFEVEFLGIVEVDHLGG
jgi:hypothetical protein